MEDIQNRTLLTTTEIVSAPDGQDRESLIKVSSSSHQHVTITEKKVTWFLAARKRGEWRKNKIAWSRSLTVLSLSHRIYLLLVKIHFPEFQQRASPMSEVSSQSKSVMDIFKPFIHNGSVSLSSNTSDSIPIKIWEKLESTVFTVVCVLWEVVHWCKCSNQRNQLRVYPSATSHSSCISSLEIIGNLETSDSCGSSWFSSFLADSVDAVGIARVLSLRRKKIAKKLTKMYTKSGKVPWVLVFSLKDLIFIFQKPWEIKFIHFWEGKNEGFGEKSCKICHIILFVFHFPAIWLVASNKPWNLIGCFMLSVAFSLLGKRFD